MIPGKISLEITYSRSRQNPILKISNFPAKCGKVRYPNEKVPSVAIGIAHRPAREMAIIVDPPRAKALGDNPRDYPREIIHSTSSRGYPPLSFPDGKDIGR